MRSNRSSKQLMGRAFLGAAVLSVSMLTACSQGGASSSESAQAASAEAAASAVEVAASSQVELAATAESTSQIASSSESESKAAGTSASASETQAPAEEGRDVYTGTLRIMTGEEVLNLQQRDLQLGEGQLDSRFAMLVFDAPQAVTAVGPGNPSAPEYLTQQEASLLCLAVESDSSGELAEWEAYDGSAITVSIDPLNTFFPSDVRIPVGQPRARDAKVVSAG